MKSTKLLALLHILFWLLLFALLFVIFSGFLSSSAAFVRTAFLSLILAGTFYFCTQVLVNILFEKKRYLLFASGIGLFSIAVIRLKFQMDFVWLKEESGFLTIAGTSTSRIVSTFPILFDIVFSTLFQLLYNRFKREQEYRERLTELTNAQLSLLKGQINPHFLFNNLNNIYSLVIRKDAQAPEMILKLSDLLRYVIYQSANSKVSVMDETEQIKNLISLCRLKNEDNNNIHLDTGKLTRNYFIEPMILIPLVENCFKHWDGDYNNNGFIRVTLSGDSKWLCFVTENSYNADKQKTNANEGGLGLENIKNRLELVYGDKVAFNISQEQNIFRVKLIIEWNGQ